MALDPGGNHGTGVLEFKGGGMVIRPTGTSSLKAMSRRVTTFTQLIPGGDFYKMFNHKLFRIPKPPPGSISS
jgi:hypothetical protein